MNIKTRILTNVFVSLILVLFFSASIGYTYVKNQQVTQIFFVNSIQFVVLILLILCLSSVNYLLISSRLQKSLDEVKLGTEAFASGDLNYRIRTSGEDEMGDIANALNSMAERLKTVTASRDELNRIEIKRKRAEHRVTLHAARNQELINLHNLADTVTEDYLYHYVLEAGIRTTESRFGLFGLMNAEETDLSIQAWSKDMAVNNTIADEPFHFSFQTASLWEECVRLRTPVIINDFDAHQLKKGHLLNLIPIHRFVAVPIFDESRIVAVGVVANKEDEYTEDDTAMLITLYHKMWDTLTWKRAKEIRTTLLKDLELKNQELERFVYTVSHDLKSPLITIKGFLGYLEKDAKSGNMERLEKDLSRIGNATDKMKDLLDDLLELSRIGRLITPPTRISMTTLTEEAIELVTGQLQKNKVEVEILSSLPDVYGDRVRLLEVMVNLIENAAKYMGTQKTPLIQIGVTEMEAKPVIYIRDNGIGIDPQFSEKIFGLFEKLDPHSSGTGVGLTVVKRIIEDYKGKIWVESEGKDTGSTFFLTVPTL
ncbi:MAG TPA: ATP-binding protein [Methanospirillum sp.]|nr:ATP-binding protein [Methanospirillum sp.]